MILTACPAFFHFYDANDNAALNTMNFYLKRAYCKWDMGHVLLFVRLLHFGILVWNDFWPGYECFERDHISEKVKKEQKNITFLFNVENIISLVLMLSKYLFCIQVFTSIMYDKIARGMYRYWFLADAA